MVCIKRKIDILATKNGDQFYWNCKSDLFVYWILSWLYGDGGEWMDSIASNAAGNILLVLILISITSTSTNDVAMTVLPNAPVDDATGLPVPTIAVATNGGVSVIKDDGSVIDLTTRML